MSYFKLIIDARDRKCQKINTRPTVRGIAFKDGKMLMIRTNRGDYKIPGGGVGRRESYEDALIREIREETGFLCTEIGRKVGEIEEFKNDSFDVEADFCMHSIFYEIQVLENKGPQKLEAYEAKLGFEPCWIEIVEAIRKNERIFSENRGIPWLEREIKILNKINQYYNGICGIKE